MTFKQCLWAAAMAGWWTALIGLAVLLVSWTAYMLFARRRPQWLIRMWGGEPGIDWTFVQRTIIIAYAVMKLIVLITVFVSLWLTLWHWQLG